MKTVPDDSGTNQDGSLYMEVIQYSVLKERAELRNKAFIDCLLENSRTDKNKDLLQNKGNSLIDPLRLIAIYY